MTRKTNKTDHVLSILTGAEGETLEKGENKEPEAPSVKHQGNVHVVMATGGNGDPVAETVKEKLQSELEQQEEKEPREEAAREEAAREEAARQEAARLAAAEPERPAAEPAPEQESAAAPEPAQAGAETPEAGAETPEAEPETPEAEPEPDEMEGYVFYNIMEKIVQDKAMKYMKQFGNCTCKRCEADTIALALSMLPPKYVVVKKDSVSPLLNFYEDHYAGQIIVEITKACITVNRNPRHNREWI